jgi:hypothetical protein
MTTFRAKLFHHLDHDARAGFHHRELLREVASRGFPAVDHKPLRDFLDGLGDFVERHAQGLYVLVLQFSYKRSAERFVDLFSDLLVSPAGCGEFGDAFFLVGLGKHSAQRGDDALNLLRTLLEQGEKDVRLS